MDTNPTELRKPYVKPTLKSEQAFEGHILGSKFPQDMVTQQDFCDCF